MANTTNLNLVKPAGTDKALVSVLNSNSDKIDAWAGTTNQALSALTTKTTISDCNTYNADGEGRIVDSTANRPFNYGVLKNLIYSLSGYRAQLAISVSNQSYAYRTSNDGGSTWSEWKELALKSAPSGPYLLITEDINNNTSDITLRAENVPTAFAITLKKYGENPTVRIKKGDTVLCTFYPTTTDNCWGQQIKPVTGINARDTLTISVTWSKSYSGNSGHYNLFAIY